MRWTTDLPTEAGDYYYRQTVVSHRQFVEIVIERYSGESWVTFDNGDVERVSDLNGEWCRIPEPGTISVEEVAQMKIKYDLLLDSATALRETIKDIYNATFASPELAPEGLVFDIHKTIRESTFKALNDSALVAKIQYAADLANSKEKS